jgi:hypothetical protein
VRIVELRAPPDRLKKCKAREKLQERYSKSTSFLRLEVWGLVSLLSMHANDSIIVFESITYGDFAAGYQPVYDRFHRG